MERYHFINYKNRKILYVDCSKLSEKKLIELYSDIEDFVKMQPKNSLVALCNVKGTKFTKNTNEALKKFIRNIEPYVTANAMVGLGTMDSIAISLAARMTTIKLKVFNSEEDAKRWLISI